MIQKTEIEMERDRLVKINRTLIRLKHSLLADQELNALLPGRLQDFDAAIQRGELLTVPAGLLEEILES